MNIVQTAMKIISKGGEGQSFAMESIRFARNGNAQMANEYLKKSDQSLLESHELHAQLLTFEAQNGNIEFSILLVHALDHLMNAMTVRDLAEEFVEYFKESGENKK